MRGTVEMTSPEFIDKDGNVPAPIAARLELARELYELSLKNSKEDCILRTATCLTILLDIPLPEAWRFVLEVGKQRVSK